MKYYPLSQIKTGFYTNGNEFILSSKQNICATITAHHMMINRNAIFQGGIRPHMYCLPVAKRERDKLALRKAATMGSDRFFLGTDSAPHSTKAKETFCGCAGIFSAVTALEFYVQVFDEEGALENLEGFTSKNGANFYELPLNSETITLKKKKNIVPKQIITSKNEKIVTFCGGQKIMWTLSTD